MSMVDSDNADSTSAALKFLADTDAPLVYIPSEGGGDQTEHLGNFTTHTVRVMNARTCLAQTDIDREGFALIQHTSKVSNFYSDEQLHDIYHAELKALLKQQLGATRVEVFDDTRRSSSLSRQREQESREPANIVHNDYTATSGYKRLNDHFAERPEEAAELAKNRFAIVNVWRSIAGPVMDHPLVFCDATSVSAEGLVAVERRAKERIGELQVALFEENQQWYFYPRLNPDEALIFKTFDSADDGRTRFTLHSSFQDPEAPDSAPPRESLESRCLVFF